MIGDCGLGIVDWGSWWARDACMPCLSGWATDGTVAWFRSAIRIPLLVSAKREESAFVPAGVEVPE
jgi:hypothetical protein